MADSSLHCWTYPTPIGRLHVAFSGATVRYTDVPADGDAFVATCQQRLGEAPRSAEPPPPLHRAIVACLEGGERFRGTVDLSGVAPLHRAALLMALEVRRGEIRPYGWIAREIGAPPAARAVGSAMARNPIPVLIPCHRVVRAGYQIGEYGCGGPDMKRRILAAEGVDVARLEALGRRGIRFSGSRTTRIFCLPGCYTGRRMQERNRVYFRSELEATEAGFRACKVCRRA